MIAPLVNVAGVSPDVLVGPETGDDAGVMLHHGIGWVATVDFITPVCDEPRRFGRVAAANSVSDVYAMGGKPLFALNLCCFPRQVPRDILSGILQGAADVLAGCGAALLGGHTVQDAELKFGLAVVGTVDPDKMLTNAGARVGQRLILTKPIGTGVLINAYKLDKTDAEGLEPALLQMERINDRASGLAVAHAARGATDITGFGLTGHALGVARSSGVGMRIDFDRIPVHDAFYELIARGVSTGSTAANRSNVERYLDVQAGLNAGQLEVLFDPQTSGGLLIAVPPENAAALLEALLQTGHRAADIGEVTAGPPRIVIT